MTRDERLLQLADRHRLQLLFESADLAEAAAAAWVLVALLALESTKEKGRGPAERSEAAQYILSDSAEAASDVTAGRINHPEAA